MITSEQFRAGIANAALKRRAQAGLLNEPGQEFEGVDWPGWILLDPVLTDAVIRDSNLRGATIFGGDLRGIVFIGCDLRQAEFVRCQAQGAAFLNCRLHNAVLDCSDFTGGFADGSSFLDVAYTGTVLRGFKFGKSAWLSANTRGGVDLRDADFSELRGFSDAHLFLAEIVRRLGVEYAPDSKKAQEFKWLWSLIAAPQGREWYPGQICWQSFLDLGTEYFPEALELSIETLLREYPDSRGNVRLEMERWKRAERLAGRSIACREVELAGFTFRTDEIGKFRPVRDRRDDLYGNVDHTIAFTESDSALEDRL